MRARAVPNFAIVAAAALISILTISAQAEQPVGRCEGACDPKIVTDKLFGIPKRRLGSDETVRSVCEKVAAEADRSVKTCEPTIEFVSQVYISTVYDTNIVGPTAKFICASGLVPLGDTFACGCQSGFAVWDSVTGTYACQASCPNGTWPQNNVCTASPPGKNNGPCPTCMNQAGTNPVNVGVGSKYQAETFYRAADAMPLAIEAHYNSYRFDGKVDAPLSPFGTGWTGITSRRVAKIRTDTSGNATRLGVYRVDGRELEFNPPASGTRWVPSGPDITDRLDEVRDGSNVLIGYRYTAGSREDIELYDPQGRLLSISNRQGLAVSFSYADGAGGILYSGGSPIGYTAPACVPPTTVPPWVYQYKLGSTTESMTPILGLLLCMSDAFARQSVYQYDGLGRTIKATNPANGQYAFEYDGPTGGCVSAGDGGCDRNNLTKVTYPDGASRRYHYNEASLINEGAACADTTPAGPGLGHLPNQLTGISDPDPQTPGGFRRYASWGYDCQGRATLSQQGDLEHADKVTITYDSPAAGQATLVHTMDDSNPNSILTSTSIFSFSTVEGTAKGTSITNAAGTPAPCRDCGDTGTYTYDPNGNITSRTDFSENKTCYGYDTARNLETRRIEGLASTEDCAALIGATSPALTPPARMISTEWHADYRLPLRIAEPKRLTTFTYGAPTDASPGNRGNVLTRILKATTDENGALGFGATTVGTQRKWTYTYNSNGFVLTENGPRTDLTDTTTYTYFGSGAPANIGKRGNLNTITNALGQVTEITNYNQHSQPITIVNADQVETVLIYDPRQRLTGRNVGGEFTSYDVDFMGNPTKITQPDNSFLSFTYDAAYRLTDITDSLSNSIHYGLDNAGNRELERIKDSAGNVVQSKTRSYSRMNKLLKETGAAGQATEYAYDHNSRGNLKSIARDPTGLNVMTSFTYDSLNRVQTVTDSSGGVTMFEYDGLDQVKSVKDPLNNVTTYTIDGLGNLTQLVSPDNGTTTWAGYDAAGNPATKTDAKGEQLTYTYDALNRLVSSGGPTGPNTTRTYDPSPGAGRLASFEDRDASGANVLFSSSLFYDSHGRVTRKVDTAEGKVLALERVYDSSGRVQAINYPSGRSVAFTYDAAGNVQSVSVDGESIASTITYHPFGKPNSWLWPLTSGNRQETRAYDQDGRLSSFTVGSPGTQRTIQYDAADRIVGTTQGSDVRTFSYLDSLASRQTDRLHSFTGGGVTHSYTYDANGNRTSRNTGAGTDTYQYTPGTNRLSQVNAATVTHDANGNITYDGTRSFAYDGNARMIQASTSGQTADYYVNGYGQRTKKTVTPTGGSATVTRFMFDETGKLVGEYNNSGNVLREFVYLGDMPLAFLQSDAVIVDNGAAATTGTWNTSTSGTGYQGSDYRYAASDATRTITWTPAVVDDTTYNVYARLPVQSISTATNASYTVTHAGGTSAPILVDQSNPNNAGKWAFLGTFAMTPGSGHGVTLTTSQVNGTVVADAIKIVNAPRNYFLRLIQANQVEAPMNVRLSNGQGTVIWSWDPAPFGDAAGSLGLNDDADNNGTHVNQHVRFPGQFFDAETNLHYANFRDCYDPGTGRFCQPDPIGLVGGLNPYSYVDADPLSSDDPLGLQRRIAANPRSSTLLGQSSTWLGQRGVWFRGQFYPSFASEPYTSSPSQSCPAPGGNFVSTPYEQARQAGSPAAAAALQQVIAGSPIYRAGQFGRQQTIDAQYWALRNPLSTPNYANQLGLPGSPTIDWVMGGTLRPGAVVVTRPAPALGTNRGGAMEAVTTPSGVTIQWFHMP